MVTGRIEIAREGWREDAAYSRGDSHEYTYNHAFVSDCFDGLARSHPKTSFDCDWLQSPWIGVVGEKGSRRTPVRLRAFSTSALTTAFSLNLATKQVLG